MCKANCITLCSSWIRPILILLYILFVIVVMPMLIYSTVKDGLTKKDQLILIGGLFVFISFPICIWHIMQHVLHFTKPKLQKPIIRILWMVPIYAINAWFGLIYPQHSFYLNSIREIYEAYVIYNFMVYLLNFLNLEMDLEATLVFKPPVKHVFPLCCMKPWVMGREFVEKCKHGVIQYTVIRPILTIISIVTEWNGMYGEGSFTSNVAYPYVVTINNVSQITAMYCLVMFYQANKEELKSMKPLPKFLCIKAVVFFSFFQSVVINFLVYFGFIKNIFKESDVDDNDYKILSIKLQDFLICIEMFIAALAHKYSFPHDPYHINIPNYDNDRTWMNALLDVFSLSDVQEDVSEHLGVLGSSLSRRLRGRSSYHLTPGASESEHLMANGNPAQVAGYQGGLSNHNLNSASDSDVSTATVSTSKNRYGAVDAKQMSQSQELVHGYGTKDGINIVKHTQPTNDYSPQYGVPKIVGNYFVQQELPIVHQHQQMSASVSRYDQQSSRSDNDNTPSKSESTDRDGTSTSPLAAIRKSDSTASDWLSTPTDEFMGIDVKGLEKDRINYKSDPRI